MKYEYNRAWAEINLDNIAHNYNEIKKHIGNTKIMGVVKADGYGHGAVEISKTLINEGVDYLAVSMIDEGIQIRNADIDVPVLVFGHTSGALMEKLIEYNITQTVYDFDSAKMLNEIAGKSNKKIKVHIKIDTGMSRLGYQINEMIENEIIKVYKLENLIIEGVYSHFSVADENDIEFTKMQLNKFLDVISRIEKRGVVIPIKHISNSGGTLFFEEARLDMVRPGIIIYGLYPNNLRGLEGWDLRPAMELKANVTLDKKLALGESVSYGRTYVTKESTKVATIPIGYADGYLRALQGKVYMLIKGKRVKVVGRICMDQCMVNTNNIEEKIDIGDEVVIIGKQGIEEIRVEDIADMLDTINYEIICVIGKRIPRVYKKGNKVVSYMNYLI